MAIKVTLGEAKPQEVKPFPKLMISIDSGNIVLFSKEKEGAVVSVGKNLSIWAIGEYSNDFLMENFTDYNESITLQNQ